MAKETGATDKSYFRKQDNNLYFSIPSNDKRRKTFLNLDGVGFWYLMLMLAPVLILTIILVYLVQFKGMPMNQKLIVFLIIVGMGYVAVSWTLCSHDNNTGKQQFSVIYQMIKHRFFQKDLIRPKFANRKNTILDVEVVTNDETIQEERRTIGTRDVIERRRKEQQKESGKQKATVIDKEDFTELIERKNGNVER